MKHLKKFEEFIGDLSVAKVPQTKKKAGDDEKEAASLDTNEPGKHYDQEDDGSDQINRHTINF